MLVTSIFSLAVFGETGGIAIRLSRCHYRCRRAKTLTFCNISVITEDIHLKLGVYVHHPKTSPYY